MILFDRNFQRPRHTQSHTRVIAAALLLAMVGSAVGGARAACSTSVLTIAE
jgi:hypothetical protein